MHQADRPDTLQTVAPGVMRILAPNPSPMTFWGTNTYLLGHDTLAVLDPGPADPSHLDQIMASVAGRPVTHILVTHSHLDHSPLARALSDKTGAPILAFGDSAAGRSPRMADLAQSGDLGGGEGVDRDFAPDERIGDGDTLDLDGMTLLALHTPGHFGNHLCFVTDDLAFTGDHVMGWATSLVSPPDGDLTDFMASCRRLQSVGATVGLPGHGAPIPDLQARLSDLIAHRTARERQIRAALSEGTATPAQIARAIYTDVPSALLPMAERNVLAHLVDLTGRGLAKCEGPLSARARYTIC